MQLTVRYKNLEGHIFGEWEKTEKNEYNRKIFMILMNDNKLYVSDKKSRNTLLIVFDILFQNKKHNCD